MEEPTPAVDSTNTSCPCTTSSWTPAGVMATRYSLFLISFGTPTRIGLTLPLPAPPRRRGGSPASLGSARFEGSIGRGLDRASGEVTDRDLELLLPLDRRADQAGEQRVRPRGAGAQLG